MNISKSKGIKPFTIKAIIVIMSFLYILGPAHLEIKKFMHTIVHTFEMPNNLLSHQKRTADIQIHQQNEHKKEVIDHNHDIIDLVDKILKEVDKENTPKEGIVKSKKIDKHKRTYEKDAQKKSNLVSFKSKCCFYQSKNKTCKGYLIGLKKPPKL